MPNKDPEIQARNQRKHYEKHKEEYRNRTQERRAMRREWVQAILKTMNCVACNESSIECFDFHHYDPTLKDKEVNVLVHQMARKDILFAEIEKCIVLCANCHRKYHKGTLQVELTADLCLKIPEYMK